MQLTVTHEYAHSRQAVWAVLSNFGDISWTHGWSKIETEGNGVGMVRRIFMEGLEQPIDEVLESLDATAFTLSYSIPRGLPMPLTGYLATVKLSEPAPGRCLVEWSCQAEPQGMSDADAQQMMTGVYQQMLQWLEARLSGK